MDKKIAILCLNVLLNWSYGLLIIFLPIRLNICFVWSKEVSHRDSSFWYPQK